MNKMKFICYMAAACIGGGFISCQSEDPWSGQTQSGFVVSLADAGVEATTRQTPEELSKDLKQDAFTLSVVRQNTGEEAYNGPCGTDPIPAKAGVYTLSAHYGDDPVLALDAPYYTGKVENVTLNGNEVKQVSIPCQVGNALLSVRYENTDKIGSLYSAYGVTVEVGEESVEIDHTSNKSAYFKAGSSVKLYFKGTWKESGEEKSMELATKLLPKTFAAGDHAIVTLRISPDMKIEITKVEVTEATIGETIPGEWLPKPKMTGFNGDVSTSLTYTETADALAAAIPFATSMAVEDIELSFDFQDGQEKFQALNGKTFILSDLSEEDAQLFDAVQIILPSLADSLTEGIIDFTQMTAALLTNDGQEAVNTINVRVKANGRWSSEEPAVYEIRTVAPQVTVTAEPEDIWTKQLTVSGATVVTGNSETILANLKFQYYENGEWKDCTGDNGTLARLADHPENAQMQVRAVYRNAVPCQPTTTFDLETPEQLPNSDMEEWQAENIVKSIWSYYPWSSDGSSFWNTNNEYTTRYRSSVPGIAGSEAYNCFPAVSYVSGRNGGKAAELRNTAAGRGNTKFIGHTELDLNKVAGELFTGDIEVVTGGTAAVPDGDHYTITKGKAFNTRPTALHFYYKYAPYNNNDTWRASIELLDENKSTIITKEVTSSEAVNGSDFGEMIITLDYEEGKVYAKCRYIYVVFSSTINTGSALPYGAIDYTLWRDGEAIDYSDAYIGSVLTIDDLSLIYDK